MMNTISKELHFNNIGVIKILIKYAKIMIQYSK